MDQEPPTSVTELLARAGSGGSSALDDVFPLMVHEADMRLIDYSPSS